MNYFELVPIDQAQSNWILSRVAERLQLRQSYADLRCSCCGKMDEKLALYRGIEADVQIRSDDDFLLSSDGFILMSDKLQCLLASHGVAGVERYMLPGDRRYVVGWPNILVPTDPFKSGIQVHGPICPVCHRPRETCFSPVLASMQLPENPMSLFASQQWVEKSRGKMTWFTTSEPVVQLLKKNEISGVRFQPLKHS